MRNARVKMIENQIRAGGVHVAAVFDTLYAVRREDFVPEAYRDYAFADMEIPLPSGQSMLTPLAEALVLQSVLPGKNDTVLEIGTGSGYMAALLAHRAAHVTTIELDTGLKEAAQTHLARHGVRNVRVLRDDGFSIDRYAPDRLFDIIVFSGSVSAIPDTFRQRLARGGRMLVFQGTGPYVQALLFQKNSSMKPDITLLFKTSAKPLKEPFHRAHFCF